MPSSEDFVDRARALIPALRERAAAAEAARMVPAETMAELCDADIFRLLQPKADGGHALSPTALWRVTREIGRGCASTAWLVGLCGINVWLLGFFSARAQTEVFGDGAQLIMPVQTGGVGSEIETRAVADGHEISGRWRMASGIDHANWVAVLVPLPDANGTVALHLVVVPADAFAIDHDSWQVLGMRATGSKDVRLPPTVVPAHRIMPWADIQDGRPHPDAGHDDPLYRIPANPLLTMSIAAPLIGAATGVVDRFLETVAERISAGTKQRQIDDPEAHAIAGRAAAEIDMAATMILSDSDALYDGAKRGRTQDRTARARVRAHVTAAAETACAASDRMFAEAGGSLLPSGTPLERAFRDIHVMASHFLLRPAVSNAAYGRLLLGLEPADYARL